jgi:hypothetical protein
MKIQVFPNIRPLNVIPHEHFGLPIADMSTVCHLSVIPHLKQAASLLPPRSHQQSCALTARFFFFFEHAIETAEL